MPAILRAEGFVVRIHGPPREHPPPHVHVERRPSGVVVVRLGHGGRAPRIWWAIGMRDGEVTRAYRLVLRHHTMLCLAWERYHGTTMGHQ
ncbi:MAG: hypothetical protein AB7N73_09965 [Gemmatimonadales bacterium]